MNLIDQAINIHGPLAGEYRARLRAVLENPTHETWTAAYSLVISDRFSLWQAWIAVDPCAVYSKAPDEPWARVPDKFTLYRALKHAVSQPPLQRTGG